MYATNNLLIHAHYTRHMPWKWKLLKTNHWCTRHTLQQNPFYEFLCIILELRYAECACPYTTINAVGVCWCSSGPDGKRILQNRGGGGGWGVGLEVGGLVGVESIQNYRKSKQHCKTIKCINKNNHSHYSQYNKNYNATVHVVWMCMLWTWIKNVVISPYIWSNLIKYDIICSDLIWINLI